MLHWIFPVAHLVITLLFVLCGFGLLAVSATLLWDSWHGVNLSFQARVDAVLESLALIAVALPAFELGETILEDEVQREAHLSAPTCVRRFLSRFMLVLIVALVIESVVLVFRFSHSAPGDLPYAAWVAFAAAALMLAWGAFVHLNGSAEELEPKAMEEAKSEDGKVGQLSAPASTFSSRDTPPPRPPLTPA